MKEEERTFQVRFSTGNWDMMEKAIWFLADNFTECRLAFADRRNLQLEIFRSAEKEICSIAHTQNGGLKVFVISEREGFRDMDSYFTGAEMQLSLRPYEMEIRLDSVPGKDSVFTWTIPVQEDIYLFALAVFMEGFDR